MQMRSILLLPLLSLDLAKPKLAKTSHLTSDLMVSLTVNQEEHLLRALADTGASSSIILEAYIVR